MASRRRSSLPPFQTKKGAHGTLYRFRIRYRDEGDEGFPDMDWYTWAYNQDHAEERFFDIDEGWRIVSIERVRERS